MQYIRSPVALVASILGLQSVVLEHQVVYSLWLKIGKDLITLRPTANPVLSTISTEPSSTRRTCFIRLVMGRKRDKHSGASFQCMGMLITLTSSFPITHNKR